MKVRELIRHLQGLDPEIEVYTVATCDCCTEFCAVESAEIGERDVGGENYVVDRWEPDGDWEWHTAPLRDDWKTRGLVIAGSELAFSPSDKQIRKAREEAKEDGR